MNRMKLNRIINQKQKAHIQKKVLRRERLKRQIKKILARNI
jgi:hypothetical protein